MVIRELRAVSTEFFLVLRKLASFYTANAAISLTFFVVCGSPKV